MNAFFQKWKRSLLAMTETILMERGFWTVMPRSDDYTLSKYCILFNSVSALYKVIVIGSPPKCQKLLEEGVLLDNIIFTRPSASE